MLCQIPEASVYMYFSKTVDLCQSMCILVGTIKKKSLINEIKGLLYRLWVTSGGFFKWANMSRVEDVESPDKTC